MNKTILSGDLGVESYTHAYIERTHTHELACSSHVDDLQGTAILCFIEMLLGASINCLDIEKDTTVFMSLPGRPVLHHAHDCVPSNCHVVALT